MNTAINLPELIASRTNHNPHMDSGAQMDHWRCLLEYRGRQMEVVFSKGKGHKGKEPTAEEVLGCLLLDASGYENARSFEDWAGEYGYDTDSRSAQATYNTIGEQARELRELLGDDYSRIAETLDA